jgi:transposase
MMKENTSLVENGLDGETLLYRTKDGRKICADVNGSYNILRKSKPDAFAHAGAKGIAAYVVQPVRLAITV